MIIESIAIKNFRQFFGEVYLEFSTDPKMPVTVVHGANGSGKTSLLNAFKWCFYGKTDFDTHNDNILNESAIQSEKNSSLLEIKVIVKFIHDHKRYAAIRTQRFKKIKDVTAESISESEIALDITGEDGQTMRSPTPYLALQSILPQDLQPYFFFNGERIEHIAGVNQSVQVKDAIRKLMGLELVDRAIEHVDKAKNQYRKVVREEVSEEQKQIHDLIESLEDEIKRHEINHERAKRDEEIAKNTLSRIERSLKNFEQSRALQERRDELENDFSKNEEGIKLIHLKQKKHISNDGFLVISDLLFEKCSDLVEENRKKGVLPYGINEQFIDDRIDLGSCICGTSIVKGSKEHSCLLDIRKTAGTDELESAYTSVSALLKSHGNFVNSFRDDYKDLSEKLASLLSSNDLIRHESNEISAQLTHIDDNKIAELELDHRNNTSKRERAIGEKGIALNGKNDAKIKLDEQKELLSRLEQYKAQQNIANLRMDKAQKIVDALTCLRESLSNQVRIDLSDRVDKTFQQIIRKPLKAIIDDEYKLQVLKMSATGDFHPVNEQSTGERQVTSLSFISSIIALAKEKHAKKAQFFQGGLYPLVMDSPFGSLDDDYREKVAANVSVLAEQVIMFVSNSQWAGKVKSACEDKVGRSYKLIYHSPKTDKIIDMEYTTISTNGFEYSTIEEASS